MTDEELDALDKLAAEKLMGYIREQDYYLQAGRNGAIIDWHPTRNIAQAFQLLEKFEWWSVESNLTLKQINCTIWSTDGRGAVFYEKTATLAIVKACLKAVGAI